MPSRRDTTDAWGETRKGFDPAGGVRAGHGKLRATGSPTRATPCTQERASGPGVGAEEKGRDGEPRKSPKAPSARPTRSRGRGTHNNGPLGERSPVKYACLATVQSLQRFRICWEPASSCLARRRRGSVHQGRRAGRPTGPATDRGRQGATAIGRAAEAKGGATQSTCGATTSTDAGARQAEPGSNARDVAREAGRSREKLRH